MESLIFYSSKMIEQVMKKNVMKESTLQGVGKIKYQFINIHTFLLLILSYIIFFYYYFKKGYFNLGLLFVSRCIPNLIKFITNNDLKLKNYY